MQKRQTFFCEEHNKHVNLMVESPPSLFIPGLTIFGAEKGDECMHELVEYLKELNKHGHFSHEQKVKGNINYKLKEWIRNDKANLVGGELVGVKVIPKNKLV